MGQVKFTRGCGQKAGPEGTVKKDVQLRREEESGRGIYPAGLQCPGNDTGIGVPQQDGAGTMVPGIQRGRRVEEEADHQAERVQNRGAASRGGVLFCPRGEHGENDPGTGTEGETGCVSRMD